jgi:nitric oxide reductase NorE protein
VNEPGTASFLWLDDVPARPAGDPSPRPAPQVPGEVGLWIFVMGDMTIFGALFAVFARELAADRAGFVAAAGELNPDTGVFNTLVLLVSSYLVVRALRGRPGHPSSGWLTGAIACGAVFIASKSLEYSIVLGAGNSPADGTFFTFYYVMTGVHLLHVVIGMCLLAVWRRRTRGVQPPSVRYREGAAVYWHMVDLLWLVIFALLYLGGGA